MEPYRHVVAVGTCHHVKNGRSGPFKHVGNDNSMGHPVGCPVTGRWTGGICHFE
jgi:hypothetical protein